jgi:uncharacterized membrane protein YidH (DUF202 family)
VLLGLVTNAAAMARYARNRKQLLEVGLVVPDPTLVYVLGVGSVLVALAMAFLLSATLRD